LPAALLGLAHAGLWVARGGELAPALIRGPFDLALAAWISIATLLACAAWMLRPARPLPDAAPPAGPWRGAWRRFTSLRSARLGAWSATVYLLLAVQAPAWSPHDPNQIGVSASTHSLPPLSRLHLIERRDGGVLAADRVEPAEGGVRVRRRGVWTEIPRSELKGTQPRDWHRVEMHLLGTDRLGRDLLSRILHGARISLGIGLIAALCAAALGALAGGIAGWGRPWLDGAVMRLGDGMMAFPRLFLVLLVMSVLPGSFAAVVLVLALTGWMLPGRLMRAQILSLRERDFIGAARVAGRGGAGIVLRHFLPHALAPLVVTTTLRIGDTMLVEAGLSFLGLGVPPPRASWGNLISGGRPELIEAWWIVLFPGLALVGAVAAFHLVGDGLRRALAPR
jgi:peptide/nickel transport system permease protein